MELIYSLNEVSQILVDFYNLTKFRIALFDKNFQELLAYATRLSSFCKNIRTDESLNEKCKFCDYQGFQKCKKTGISNVYQCHIGLSEIIIPVKFNSIIIGYIMSGQIFTTDTPYKNLEELKEFLNEAHIDFHQLALSFKGRKVISSNLLASTVNFMEIMAYYLYQTEKLSLNPDSLAFQIDTYIIKHLNEDLSVEQLALQFNYHKTTFYKVTNEIFGTGIMRHIRQLRIQTAKNYLSNTDLHIYEIANLVGIEDYNYFTKVFKIEAKCTPKEFRQNSIRPS